MSSQRIELAQNVLKIEAEEISKASQKLSNEFSEAIECILNCKGRIIPKWNRKIRSHSWEDSLNIF